MGKFEVFTPNLPGSCVPVRKQIHGLFRVMRRPHLTILSTDKICGKRQAGATVSAQNAERRCA
jgi:hypothetical protein